MTPSITHIWTPSADEWDDAWSSCPYSTFFHSREWAEIWAEYRNRKTVPDPLGLVLSDGTRILLPFSKEKMYMGFLHRHLSSPAGTFGGWLADIPLTEPQQAVLMQFVAKRYSNLLWRFNPYEKVLLTDGFSRVREDETHALDLSAGFDEIHLDWSKGHASSARKARKARKAGVRVRVAQSQEDWEKYFRVYEDSLSRWGANTTSTYSWALFEIILQRASPNIKLWLAEYDGRVVAGALCFHSSKHVVYWHGAALSNYFEVRPVNLLMYETIRDATERGFRWFDFNPSGGLEGVKAFKQSFGAMALQSNIGTNASTYLRIMQLIRCR